MIANRNKLTKVFHSMCAFATTSCVHIPCRSVIKRHFCHLLHFVSNLNFPLTSTFLVACVISDFRSTALQRCRFWAWCAFPTPRPPTSSSISTLPRTAATSSTSSKSSLRFESQEELENILSKIWRQKLRYFYSTFRNIARKFLLKILENKKFIQRGLFAIVIAEFKFRWVCFDFFTKLGVKMLMIKSSCARIHEWLGTLPA